MLSKINLSKTKYLNQLLKHIAIYGLLSICIFSMSSCGDDPDELIGSWVQKEILLTNCADPGDNQSFFFDDNGCTDLQGLPLCTTGVITFSEDGTYRNVGSVTYDGDVINDLSDNGTWSRTGVSVVLCDSTGDCNGSTIDINGDRITVKDGVSDCDRTAEYARM